MKKRFAPLAGAVMALSMLGTAACGATADKETGKAATGLRIMVPNAPGGGYDTTARTVAKVMEETGTAGRIQVFNLPGAGGTVGLQRVINERGNGKLAMQMGLGVVGASYASKSKATVTQTTPIAKLIEEAGAIVVPKDSPYRTIGDLVAAWKKDPKKVTVGGGSSPGGPDHLLPMRLAKTVGIDPKKVNYVSYDGGGELLPALLGNKIAFGASGYGEFLDQVQSGQLRVLAVTAEQPIPSLKDVPTLKGSGIDLVFANWRGVLAPPGIGEDDRKTWIDAFTRMRDSERWKAECAKRGWTDSFMTGERFAGFLAEQDKSVAAILTELGLA
ncbi:tripartite tricarboxylate transporter substrate-binding protein [Actinomadura viridis]|uniref:Tricarboxylic transport membrane protein n=1 Tax=Actinomadura viridis TaxID=58110 RepID=A0A931DNK1_9ACTN|nr:tripartite tricarboxylate transporter substrate-binding protein [Actinomadura viridis]MBG6092887.1 putative tricarboxylic transport membrane protein [Actinomadura viridis]